VPDFDLTPVDGNPFRRDEAAVGRSPQHELDANARVPLVRPDIAPSRRSARPRPVRSRDVMHYRHYP